MRSPIKSREFPTAFSLAISLSETGLSSWLFCCPGSTPAGYHLVRVEQPSLLPLVATLDSVVKWHHMAEFWFGFWCFSCICIVRRAQRTCCAPFPADHHQGHVQVNALCPLQSSAPFLPAASERKQAESTRHKPERRTFSIGLYL